MPDPEPGITASMELDGQSIPVDLDWEPRMEWRSREGGIRELPRGEAYLQKGEKIRLRASVRRRDGQRFTPGKYRLSTDVGRLVRALRVRGGGPWKWRVGDDSSVVVVIGALDSPEAVRRYHRKEATLSSTGPARVDHAEALVKLPGSTWDDQLVLASVYSDMGRYCDAATAYKPFIPELVSFARRSHGGRYALRPARAFLGCGDAATARQLLVSGGFVEEGGVAAVLDRLKVELTARAPK